MQCVEQKFTNFKRFVGENTQDVMSAGMQFIFMNLSLDQFLAAIASDIDNEVGVKENIIGMTNKVLEIIGTTRENFSPQVLKKFNLYMEYFVTVSRACQ